MQKKVETNRKILASPQAVWEIISDLESMGRLSPENSGGRWEKGVNGVEEGVVFRGKNKNGFRQWSTKVLITECEPPKKLSFSLRVGGKDWCEWSYQIDAVEDGCVVTESWTDMRTKLQEKIGWRVSGVSDRASHNLKNMEVTLENLALLAESK
ncbi:MAG: SRPBCC family protein [Acidimicrobiales bacterium]|nr:SRPBCC family protein [Acidimicrobiales bacterium]